MAITTECPRCNRRFNLADEMAGRQAQCPCGNLLLVPSPSEDANSGQPAAPTWRVMTPDGQVHGPVTKQLLDQAVAAGRLTGAAHIIREDQAGWISIVVEYPHLAASDPYAHTRQPAAPTLPPGDFCQRCRSSKSPWATHCPRCGAEDPYVRNAKANRGKEGFWRAYDQLWGSS